MEKEEIIIKAKATLIPKKKHLIRLFGRLGLTVKQLTTKELIRLFYQIYNQESVIGDTSAAFSERGALIRGKEKTKENAIKYSQKAQVEQEPDKQKGKQGAENNSPAKEDWLVSVFCRHGFR